ncbi:hypothetical protein [Gloeothece verrucosa]|uniref:Glycosyl transferase family 2 n=1 Tax=Gloeothece verrucosa (strain PCC 7822) TaxID=497965 RepID=E0UNA1_GLOV7|nr:hypothetical protein [Gloeothece verrucosa]ADN18431.1 hypothetical protein Cyan7822_6758 [Gloeothece verrucosa PCC 7822]
MLEFDRQNNVSFEPDSIVDDLIPIDLFPRIIERGIFCMGGVCIRRKFLNEADFVTHLNIGEDWLLWCRLTAKGPFIFIGEDPIIEIRRHHTNKTQLPISKLVKNWNKSREIFFLDPVIKRKLPSDLAAKHYQANKFYTYYDVTKLCWRLKAYDFMIIYLMKSLITALENTLSFFHIFRIFMKEAKRYLR